MGKALDLPELPAAEASCPREEDLSQGMLESIDMDSYRIEKQAAQRVQLSDQDAEIDPVPTDGGSHRTEPELERLSNIIRSFNDLFGNITWAEVTEHIMTTREAIEAVGEATAWSSRRPVRPSRRASKDIGVGSRS